MSKGKKKKRTEPCGRRPIFSSGGNSGLGFCFPQIAARADGETFGSAARVQPDGVLVFSSQAEVDAGPDAGDLQTDARPRPARKTAIAISPPPFFFFFLSASPLRKKAPSTCFSDTFHYRRRKSESERRPRSLRLIRRRRGGAETGARFLLNAAISHGPGFRGLAGPHDREKRGRRSSGAACFQ